MDNNRNTSNLVYDYHESDSGRHFRSKTQIGQKEVKLTARSIQFLAVGLLIPTILILAINKTLASETIAALLGSLAGYLLSDIGRYEPKESADKHITTKDTKNGE